METNPMLSKKSHHNLKDTKPTQGKTVSSKEIHPTVKTQGIGSHEKETTHFVFGRLKGSPPHR